MKETISHPLFLSIVSFVLGLISAYVVVIFKSRVTKNEELEKAKNKEGRDKLFKLKKLLFEINKNTSELHAILQTNYVDFIFTDSKGIILCNNQRVRVFSLVNYSERFGEWQDHRELLPLVINNGLDDFYSILDLLFHDESYKPNNDYLLGAKVIVHDTERACIKGTYLVDQLEWKIMELENPQKTEEFIKSKEASETLDGKYRGEVSVPWFKPFHERDNTTSSLHKKYHEAEERYRNTGAIYEG